MSVHRDSVAMATNKEQMDKELIITTNLAGYCMECMLWKLLLDCTSQLIQIGPCLLDANHIATDGLEFYIVGETETCSEVDAVWALGATISQLSSGHPVFGGKGKRYQEQHPFVQLPSLRQEHDGLTEVVRSCLQATTKRRPSLNELREHAKRGYEESQIQQPILTVHAEGGHQPLELANDYSDGQWPEEMIPITSNT